MLSLLQRSWWLFRIKKNVFPLKKIHKEYIKIAECVLLNDYKKGEELTKNYLNTSKMLL